jgi:FAD/FMN-containing dehydrogenase
MDIQALRDAISGDVLTPGDDDYLASATVSHGPGSPLAVIKPADAADVATAIGFARDGGLELSVRGGGHDSLGRSTNNGGVVIDMRSLAGIAVGDRDDDGALVTIGGGAVWGDVAATLAPHGLAISSGDTKTVGVGGLTLGGGVGWFVRLWGLAIDSLVSAQVVLADGRIVTAGAASEPDLFWAIRGGGGNFGVVTTFTFRARPLPDGVVSGSIQLAPDADLAAAFRVWRDVMRDAPEQLTTSYLALPSFGEGVPPMSEIAFVWAGGDVDAATVAIEPLLTMPGVTGHTIDAMPYADVLMDEQPDADQVDAPAMKMIDDNGFAARFDDDLIAELMEFRRELGDAVLMVRLLGGAYGRVAPEATAWAFRDTEAWIISATFVPEAMHDEAAPRVHAAWSRLEPWLKGMYGNFSSLDNPVATMYPPETLARLQSIKAVYDPTNLFHRTHNITPAAPAG